VVDSIPFDQPIDNLSVDSNGDIFAATFPRAFKFIKSTKRPLEVDPPTAIWRFRKGDDGHWEQTKIMEDDGSVLPGATTAVHDVKSKRYFIGGRHTQMEDGRESILC
jgi:hypothetical protein